TALGVIFLAAFIRLWQHPPTLNITLSGLQIPDRMSLALTLKHEPADIEVRPIEEPIPEDIMIYCEAESDSWAQTARKSRALALKRELGNWDAAFRMLQLEDHAQ